MIYLNMTNLFLAKNHSTTHVLFKKLLNPLTIDNLSNWLLNIFQGDL
jgi:hypothetical protein